MERINREQVMQNMLEITAKLNDTLNYKEQQIQNISYFEEFEFEGSGLYERSIYVVKIKNTEQTLEKNSNDNEEAFEQQEPYYTYEIYNKQGELIARIGKEGKIEFDSKYLQNLQKVSPELFKKLNLKDIDFKMPEELKENDITMTESELEELAKNSNGDNKKSKGSSEKQDDKDKKQDDKEEGEEEKLETETDEQRKEKVAEVLDVKPEEIKGLSQIDPNEKITDEYNMRDLIPETQGYERVEIACSKGDNKQGDGRFTILGVKRDGTRQVLNSIGSIEGVSTNKKVISINDDGSQVQEKSVQGLLRINARNREDGIAISLGNYGQIDTSYVRNILDKETRRSTPIKTLDSENRHYPNHQVRENAGDSIEEVKKESTIYREKQEEGIDPQSLDGIEQNNNDNIEFVKQRIVSDAIDQGQMSRQELDDFIETKLNEVNITLTKEEQKIVISDIKERILDESRFPVREPKQN